MNEDRQLILIQFAEGDDIREQECGDAAAKLRRWLGSRLAARGVRRGNVPAEFLQRPGWSGLRHRDHVDRPGESSPLEEHIVGSPGTIAITTVPNRQAEEIGREFDRRA